MRSDPATNSPQVPFGEIFRARQISQNAVYGQQHTSLFYKSLKLHAIATEMLLRRRVLLVRVRDLSSKWDHLPVQRRISVWKACNRSTEDRHPEPWIPGIPKPLD